MSIYNEILSARFNRALTKLFSIKGPAPSPAVSSEVMPVHPFASGVENRFLEGWDRFGMTVYTTAVAAQNSAFQIRNPSATGPATPSSSKILMVIEKMTITVTLADLVEIRIASGLADLANLITTTRLDARTARNSMAIASWANNVAAAGSVIDHVTIAANTSQGVILTDNNEMTVLPGDAIRVNTIGVNEILRVSYQWRERLLEDSEVQA